MHTVHILTAKQRKWGGFTAMKYQEKNKLQPTKSWSEW